MVLLREVNVKIADMTWMNDVKDKRQKHGIFHVGSSENGITVFTQVALLVQVPAYAGTPEWFMLKYESGSNSS